MGVWCDRSCARLFRGPLRSLHAVNLLLNAAVAFIARSTSGCVPFLSYEADAAVADEWRIATAVDCTSLSSTSLLRRKVMYEAPVTGTHAKAPRNRARIEPGVGRRAAHAGLWDIA